MLHQVFPANFSCQKYFKSSTKPTKTSCELWTLNFKASLMTHMFIHVSLTLIDRVRLVPYSASRDRVMKHQLLFTWSFARSINLFVFTRYFVTSFTPANRLESAPPAKISCTKQIKFIQKPTHSLLILEIIFYFLGSSFFWRSYCY